MQDMPIVIIERAPVSGVGVYGDLYFVDNDKKTFLCHTIEREWQNDTPEISCIRNGVYWIEPHKSPNHGECYIVHNELNNVTKYKNDKGMRWGILFHKENWCTRLLGCIAPVTGFKVDSWTNNELCGYSSKSAFNKLMSLLGGRKAKLILKNKECAFNE